MPSSEATVQATKAARYFNALCKHFARKVPVEHAPGGAQVQFPMGTCRMSVDGHTMRFRCSAESTGALRRVESIVAEHVTNFGELKDTWVHWRDGGPDA
jgi:hypothetical protein